MSHDPQPGPGGPNPPGVGPNPPLSQGDERLWATVAHVSIPFLGFIGSLIVWAVFKDRSGWLRESATEALNFSILYTIAQFIAVVLMVVVIGMLLLPLIGIAGLILCILAAIAANRGEPYRYPVNLRLVK
ncbi:DUF4870 domain-containing protein [Microlunatus speluncae]|uniref:DUF4870 domain-containing protein n=1 Tax=Microlunatus speluncae TaxID=2594267 RepID=UPI00126615F1|nr:DUF4870 domain-containing protein [Microlunatus speluncae]